MSAHERYAYLILAATVFLGYVLPGSSTHTP